MKELSIKNTETGGGEVEKQLSLTNSLLPLVRKISFFSVDHTDEFKVTREDGSIEGIFKTWAVPVIPFLETGQERHLAWCIHNRTGNFLETLTPELRNTLWAWHKRLKENPVRMWQTLERWRNFCEIYDRRLTKTFQEKRLPVSKEERLAELYWRLKIAFAYASPFYHLEAMVADKNQTPANPVEVTANIGGGGALDVVGMLLPAALSATVATKSLDWSGINWNGIRNLTSSLKPGTPEFNIIFRISKLIGVPLEHVIFAANALEWIPVSVGGKRADISPTEAQILTESTLQKSSSPLSSTAVGRDFNAQIRFLNWFPGIENQLNFDNGEGWRYSAACDTSNQLLREVSASNPFNPEFAGHFHDTISPQISHVDATSAKGRLVMKLIEEGKLKPEFYTAIRQSRDRIIASVSQALAKQGEEESLIGSLSPFPRSLVGGKAAGIREAACIFGIENIVSGVVITTEAISDWLQADRQTHQLINQLDTQTDIQTKLKIGDLIRKRIQHLKFPASLIVKIDSQFPANNLLAIRSSSFDEDSDTNGTAAGIYQTQAPVTKANIEQATKNVIASFFTEKAISYRQLHQLSDNPMFAILIQPFIDGPGGAGFSSGNGSNWEIAVGKTPSVILGGTSYSEHDSYKKEGDEVRAVQNKGWLDRRQVDRVAQYLLLAEKCLGSPADIEFVEDENGQIKILQMRVLKNAQSPESDINQQAGDLIDLETSSVTEITLHQTENGHRLRLIITDPEVDLDQFQGSFFRFLVRYHLKVGEIVIPKRIPRTNHFANICENLGIKLTFANG